MTKSSKAINNLLFKILEKPDFDKLQRNILASNPRVTKVNIMIFATIQRFFQALFITINMKVTLDIIFLQVQNQLGRCFKFNNRKRNIAGGKKLIKCLIGQGKLK